MSTTAEAVPAVVPEEAHRVLRVEPGATRSLGLGEIWRYRELLYFLTWRDVKVRYKQTALGASWAVIQPLMTMVVFTIFFGKLARMPSDDIPYPLFSYAGLLPWTYFAQVVGASATSVVGSSNLITKVYFPRMVIPGASALAALVDFAMAFAVLLVLLAAYHFHPALDYQVSLRWSLLLLPLFLLMAMATALGVGLWLAAVNVRYRDVRHVVPFIIQFWLFATPVIYPSSLLQGQWRLVIYALNPMVGVVEGFRWGLFGLVPRGGMVWVSALVTVTVLVSGAFYFRRMERIFADLI
ncbi:MAG: ABC transporter permease [Gemmatimonadota bacterium]